jgi:formylglycine-generating enzyme required for sulfatase activity
MEAFEVAVHLVTQGEWQALMGTNPSYYSRFGGGQSDVKDISDDELKLFPVETVSWEDAQEFIQKLMIEKAAGATPIACRRRPRLPPGPHDS